MSEHDDLINVSRATLKNELKVRDERLLRMAKLLETKKFNKKNKFSLAGWYEDQGPECGTVACACGWAGQDKWFNERGFFLRHVGQIAIPKYGNHTQWDAVLRFFRLTDSEAMYLFSQYKYPNVNKITPKTVARRIRQFIKNGLPETPKTVTRRISQFIKNGLPE